MKIKYLTFNILLFLMYSCEQKDIKQIDLSGNWHFKVDSLDKGILEQWYTQKLTDTIRWPGSMNENGKGNDITIHTRWTGEILDSSWYFDKKYAPYRNTENIKIPFWLQPEKHYVGAAWYQKEVDIPSDWAHKHIELFLERPHWETQLWIDGQQIGMRNSLGTPHTYPLTDHITPGTHTISIRVDNSIKEIKPGSSSHSITDNTQTNWNGIIGDIKLTARSKVFIEHTKLYPDITHKEVTVIVKIQNCTKEQQKSQLTLFVQPYTKSGERLKEVNREVVVNGTKEIKITYPMGDSPLLWDEFSPTLYTMQLTLKSKQGVDKESVTFGMREFKAGKKQFSVNGRPVFLRGTLECAIFPKTGYPPTDIEAWKRILKICHDHGLNHMRFHSWCPPEAAFQAADELGVYLQVEASSWTNDPDTKIGNGDPIDQWVYEEAAQILDTYGNHPSFCMMSYGNEPGGDHQKTYLSNFVNHVKKIDSSKVYTGGSGWPFIENADFYDNAKPRIQHWGEGLNSIINSTPPQTVFDYSALIQKTPMPYVSHEMGQWCVYPNFKEIAKYNGVLKPKNFEIFKESLTRHHMGNLADSLLLASGKLQALCYKADIEAALRTKDFAGFQLLDLHDFPGQGTALVGVLDAFWDEKGYISPEAFRRFCSQTVPLARLEKRIFDTSEHLRADIEVAHYGEHPLPRTVSTWTLVDEKETLISEGSLPKKDIPLGNGIVLGTIDIDLSTIEKAHKLTLSVMVGNHSNSWDIWVYPHKKETIIPSDAIMVTDQLNTKTHRYLEQGGKVLLNITKGDIKPEKGGAIGVGFSSIFWNTAYTSGQKPHTLGILCDPAHPALADFPTEYHSNWQWWDAMSNANAIVVDAFSPTLKPIVRLIDDWFENRNLALIFEAKIGRGKLIVSGIDLHTGIDQRPEAQQLLYSLKKYMISDHFNPVVTLSLDQISSLFNDKK